jgi:hypothetical protein
MNLSQHFLSGVVHNHQSLTLFRASEMEHIVLNRFSRGHNACWLTILRMPVVKNFISFCYFIWRYFVNWPFHSRDRQWHNLHVYLNMHKLSSDMSFLTFLLACILPVCTWDLKMCKYLYTTWWSYKPASYLSKVNSGVTLIWQLLL